MSFLCPICKTKMNIESGQCEQSHAFERINGVLILMTDSDKKSLHEFENKLFAVRKRDGLVFQDSDVFEKLPFVENDLIGGEWKTRQADLRLIENHLKGKSGLKILEIGGWNSWLTNQLQKFSSELYVVDYFKDAFDGLGAQIHYKKADWNAIQMELEQTELIEPGFDLIVINRAINYFVDPLDTLLELIAKLNEGGQLIVTGGMYNKRPEDVNSNTNTVFKQFEAKEGFSLHRKEFFGCFGMKELNHFKKQGFKVRFSGSQLGRLLRRLIKKGTRTMITLTYTKNG